jgi:hypothetical protein
VIALIVLISWFSRHSRLDLINLLEEVVYWGNFTLVNMSESGYCISGQRHTSTILIVSSLGFPDIAPAAPFEGLTCEAFSAVLTAAWGALVCLGDFACFRFNDFRLACHKNIRLVFEK